VPIITLPDGNAKTFSTPVTIMDVAESIGPGLAKAALGGKINDQLLDISHAIESDANLSIITGKDPDGLEIIRHSTAHLLAQAVKRLFPMVQVTIGPVIEEGFFYDFAFSRSFTPEDLTRIDAKMREIVKEDLPVTRREVSRDEAIDFFRDLGEEYKVKIIQDIPQNEILSLYTQGDFTDLCRGPHVPRTGILKVFALTKLAGAYWRGDSNNEMLQRIYGTAFQDKKSLALYLKRIEEAEKRYHPRLGVEYDLFHFQDEAPGMAFWHPNGWTLYRTLEEYLRTKLDESGYQEIRTPQLADVKLWKESGHWDMYNEHMFITESENRTYCLKPMSCPCHIQIFNQGIKSYRDLPIRFAEYGCCHRYEPSGTLHGLMRVRAFTQDDGHIFCTQDQVQEEVAQFNRMLTEVYRDCGFTDIVVRLATRPDKRVGADELWDVAETTLEAAMRDSGFPEWELAPGEGAFYGPKIEYHLRDCLGRMWQCGTLQLDYCLPERLGASFVDEEGNKNPPVMLHRAILGTFERFIGILIENCAGKFPVWLAPVQVVVMTITDNQHEYAQKIFNELKKMQIRAKLDLRNEKIGYKIREHTLMRVPYHIILGDRELETSQVSVRLCTGDDLGAMALSDFITRVEQDVIQKKSVFTEE
jgi:threonyl-tRNA synthetase